MIKSKVSMGTGSCSALLLLSYCVKRDVFRAFSSIPWPDGVHTLYVINTCFYDSMDGV